jgi:hypothetical protein
MVLAAWVKCASTCCALAPTLHVFLYCQKIFTAPTKDCSFISVIPWPHIRFVRLACVMAADTSVKFVAAEMIDGDDVEGRVPMRTLCKRRDGYAMDCGDCRKGG